jgi:WD40 repeat protein
VLQVGHKDFVGPVAWRPAVGGHGSGAIITGVTLLHQSSSLTGATGPDVQVQALLTSGSRDTTVIAWDPATAAALETLTGHTLQVTALAVTASGDVVSASLDKCAACAPRVCVRMLASCSTARCYSDYQESGPICVQSLCCCRHSAVLSGFDWHAVASSLPAGVLEALILLITFAS